MEYVALIPIYTFPCLPAHLIKLYRSQLQETAKFLPLECYTVGII